MNDKKLSHFDEQGNARMVNVGEKARTARRALAEGCISMRTETLRLIRAGGHAKGDVLLVARVAGIMAAKRTADLIPLCHPLSLTRVEIEFAFDDENSRVRSKRLHHRGAGILNTPPQSGAESEEILSFGSETNTNRRNSEGKRRRN